jgi:sulfite exporter TauE/SafE
VLGSITPLGQRSRHGSWASTVASYTVFSAVAGSLVGLVAGSVGWAVDFAIGIPGWVRLASLGFALSIAIAMDLHAIPVPTIYRQVNENWMPLFRGWIYGGAFGFQLGLGVVTVVTTATIYASIVAATLSSSPVEGATIGFTFGLVRALPMLSVALVRTPADLARVDEWLRKLERPAHRGALFTQIALLTVVSTVSVV